MYATKTCKQEENNLNQISEISQSLQDDSTAGAHKPPKTVTTDVLLFCTLSVRHTKSTMTFYPKKMKLKESFFLSKYLSPITYLYNTVVTVVNGKYIKLFSNSCFRCTFYEESPSRY